MPLKTYRVRFTYTFTQINGQPISVGAYCGWVTYLSTKINGTFPNATSGQLNSSIYLAPLFYPPASDNIGLIFSLHNPTLKVVGGKVTLFGGSSTIGPLNLNIDQSGFSFGYAGSPPQNGSGMIKLDDPVLV